MNRRRCPYCKSDQHFGSSPYGATCLNCGRTDKEFTPVRAFGVIATAYLLVFALALVLAAHQWRVLDGPR